MNYVLGEKTAQALADLLKREQGRVAGRPGQPAAPPVVTANWQLIRVTGPAVDDYYNSGFGLAYSDADYSGERQYYPAIVELWNAREETATDLGEVWLIDRNDDDLDEGRVYIARQFGDRDVNGVRRPVFVTVASGIALGDLPEVDDYEGYGDTYYGDGCELQDSLTIRTSAVDPVSGECVQTDTTIHFPFPVVVCQTVVT